MEKCDHYHYCCHKSPSSSFWNIEDKTLEKLMKDTFKIVYNDHNNVISNYIVKDISQPQISNNQNML